MAFVHVYFYAVRRNYIDSSIVIDFVKLDVAVTFLSF